MVKTLEFCFCLFCLCSSFLLKGVNLVCEEKVITLWFLYIYRAKKKEKTWEKLGSCISVKVLTI